MLMASTKKQPSPQQAIDFFSLLQKLKVEAVCIHAHGCLCTLCQVLRHEDSMEVHLEVISTGGFEQERH